MARISKVTYATELAIGRIRKAGIGSLTPRDLILTVIPEVELRIDDLLREIVSKAEFSQTPLGSFLIEDNFDSYLKTWEGRRRVLKSGFGFDLSGSKIGQEFMLLVDVRNSLMHGNGSVTIQQSNNFVKVLSLKNQMERTLAVQFQGQRLILDGLSRLQVCDAACSYLVEVDCNFPGLR